MMNLSRLATLGMLSFALAAHSASVTGTVTNKTTNKPSAGDSVALVDVQSGMSDVARATTDANGHYTLQLPGSGPYLIRATHQGATYFIAAPQGAGPGDLTVYDSAAKVDQIGITGDVIEFETENGKLYVNERYYVHNASNPPRTQYAARGFEFALPDGAVFDGAQSSRPSGLPTNAELKPAGAKNHYFIDIPIQPSLGEKDTVFDLRYHLPYSSGKYTFTAWESLNADAVIVVLPKSMTLTSTAGFTQVPEDPSVLTWAVKNIGAGHTTAFTLSGAGTMPREEQGQTASQQQTQMGGDQTAQDTTQPNGPGGGIGAPIHQPDSLSKYKWWILSALALLFAGAAAFLLRKPAGSAPSSATSNTSAPVAAAPGNTALLAVLKDELFALESEKLGGSISDEEYGAMKSALETVLRRALQRKN